MTRHLRKASNMKDREHTENKTKHTIAYAGKRNKTEQAKSYHLIFPERKDIGFLKQGIFRG